MTYQDLVRQYFPDADDELADYVLWNETAYPACGPEHLRLQLAQFKCTMEFLCGGPFLTGEESLEQAMEDEDEMERARR